MLAERALGIGDVGFDPEGARQGPRWGREPVPDTCAKEGKARYA